jgi:hypothetical protein
LYSNAEVEQSRQAELAAKVRAQEAEAERVRLEAEKATLAERVMKAEERNFLELDKRLAQHAMQPATVEAKALPTLQPDTAPSKMISFTRRNNKMFAESDWTDQQLCQTFEALWKLLKQVRTATLNSKGKISGKQLRDMFKSTPLGKAVDDDNWNNWSEVFASDPKATPKNIAKVFLRDTTGLQISTLETKISTARSKIRKSNL